MASNGWRISEVKINKSIKEQTKGRPHVLLFFVFSISSTSLGLAMEKKWAL